MEKYRHREKEEGTLQTLLEQINITYLGDGRGHRGGIPPGFSRSKFCNFPGDTLPPGILASLPRK